MRDMSEAEVAWLAGLVEGEGSFHLHRGRRPRLQVSMTDEDVIRKAHAMVGVGSVGGPYQSEGKRKAYWQWNVYGAEVIELLLPHLGLRRAARAQEVLRGAA